MIDKNLIKQISAHNIECGNNADINYDKVKTSRFFLRLEFTCIIVFLLVYGFVLFGKRFTKPTVTINQSSLYTPQYK